MRNCFPVLALTLVLLVSVPLEAQSTCLVVGTAGARERARAEEVCSRTIERFAELFGREAPAALVDVTDTLRIYGVHPSADGWLIHWPSSERLTDIYADPGLVERAWDRTLPHEIGHLLMFSLAAELKLRAGAGEYTTPFPDWLDEGAAVWMEPGAERAEMAAIRGARIEVPSVREIVERKHPHLSPDDWISSLARTIALPCPTEARCYRPRWSETMIVTQRLDRGEVVADTVYVERLPESAGVDEFFYLYSNALLLFVHERGGSAAVWSIVTRLAEGSQPFQAMVGAPGLPGSAEELEREWVGWFTRRYLEAPR